MIIVEPRRHSASGGVPEGPQIAHHDRRRLSKRFDAKDAALDLLSALRFFEPKPKDELLSSYGYPPILTLAEAAEAYAALTRGFSRLWAQIEYAKLKAL